MHVINLGLFVEEKKTGIERLDYRVCNCVKDTMQSNFGLLQNKPV